jgi:hypothetical protein
MAALLDSTSVFTAKLEAVGINAEYVRRFQSANIDTHVRLAYVTPCQPGAADELPFLNFLKKALQLQEIYDLSLGQLSSIRRVWFEAHTVAVCEVREKVTRTESDMPSRMPNLERDTRITEQRPRLNGVCITTTLEPSHQLVDYVNQMKTDEQLRYLDPAKCTSREQELGGVKKESFLKQQTDGSIKLVNQETAMKADLSGEFRIRVALQRRSLAMDLVKNVTYSRMEAFHDRLFHLMMRDVIDTHHSISMEQILRADKAAFISLVDTCRSGISINQAGTYPIGKALDDVLNDPIVSATLQPMPKGGPHRDGPYEKGERKRAKVTEPKRQGSHDANRACWTQCPKQAGHEPLLCLEHVMWLQTR